MTEDELRDELRGLIAEARNATPYSALNRYGLDLTSVTRGVESALEDSQGLAEDLAAAVERVLDMCEEWQREAENEMAIRNPNPAPDAYRLHSHAIAVRAALYGTTPEGRDA